MVGRRVQYRGWDQAQGVVERWEPLSAALCDALVRHDDGSYCFYASRDLRPTDGKGSLPSRDEAQRAERAAALVSLRQLERQMVAEIRSHRPWPGMEFGKAILGKAVQEAIGGLERS